MSKIITFHIDYDNEYQIVGISSHLRAYKLIYFLNNVLNYRFKRANDLAVNQSDTSISYSTFIYIDRDSRTEYCLIANHHPEQKLIPSLRQIDFFLLIKSMQENNAVNEIINKIRAIPRILTAYKIDENSFRDIDILLNDVEMHMLENTKTFIK